MLDCVVNGREFDSLKHDRRMLESYRPAKLCGSRSIEVDYEKQYENMKLIIAQKTNIDVTRLTVFQYYTYAETVKKQYDNEQSALKRARKR